MRRLVIEVALKWAVSFSILCSWAVLNAGQTPEPKSAQKKAPPPGVIHSITFKGNRTYAGQDLLNQTGLKIGEHVTAADIEVGRKKLESTELFNNVSDEFRFSGTVPPAYDITYQLTENEQRFPLRFERLDISQDAMRDYLRHHVSFYAETIPGTEAVLHRYTQAVQEFVARKSPSLKIKAYVSNDDPQQLAVVFTPDTPAPTISQVFVSGNEAIDTGTILRAVNQVAIGVPLSDARLKQILDGAIRPLYAAKGYAAVTFPKVETEPSNSNLGVVVKVQIKDGPSFKFGAIRFRGSGLEEEEVRSNIPFKPGQAFNSEQVDNFRLDLLHRMRRRGLLDASIATDAQPDDSKHVVNVLYSTVPGEVYNFAKLDIVGLDINTEPAIQKLWGEKPGKPFNPDYPDFFLKRVQEQGLFDNLADTHADYSSDVSTHTVTVHLYFKGGQSRAEQDRKKKEEEEKRKGDGTWNPYPQMLPALSFATIASAS